MDKYIHDDKNGLWYALQGEYYTPCLVFSNQSKKNRLTVCGDSGTCGICGIEYCCHSTTPINACSNYTADFV